MVDKVSDVYPELAHYTSSAGLKGILESRTLWASHARFLNDSREFEYFLDVRCKKLMEDAINTAYQDGKIELNGYDDHGNKLTPEEIAQHEAQVLTSAARIVTATYEEPYLFSFCGTIEPRVARDGLLSQWRAYGLDGGYALIFDTRQLEQRLAEEAKLFCYQHMSISNVHYYHEGADTGDAAEEIRKAEETLRGGVLRFYRKREPSILDEVYASVRYLCCLFKHWGFHEEHEVRVVAIPAHESLYSEAGSDTQLEPRKPTQFFLRNGCLVPYIELLRDRGDRGDKGLLPIKEILVGPHRDATRRRDALYLFLKEKGIDCPVHVSSIPFVGTAN